MSPSQAQSVATGGESRLEPVIVEGSRLGQATTEIGSSVTILTADDLAALDFDFALDAIATTPGVTINSNGALGGVATARIRGAASEQTLVLIDGVPVNNPTSPGGGFDFARLDTATIERIEVLKGPQSTLWGGDAIGGVISITTRSPDAGTGGNLFAEYGSYNTARGGAAFEAATGRADVRLAITGTTSDGLSKADEDNGNTEEDSYESLTVSSRGGIALGGDARLSASVLWTDAAAEFDSFAFGAEGSVADGDELGETEELAAGLALTGSLFSGRLENLLRVGYADISSQNFTDGAPGFSAEGDRVVYRYQGTLGIDDRQKLAFGAEREESTANGDETSIDGLFALYELTPTDALTLTGGLRVDEHERFGSETTGRVAAAYNPTPSLTLRASWGQGFKAPTIFQTTFICGFCGLSEPNADLRPETSEAVDIGLDWRSDDGRAEAGISLFDQEAEDLIDFDFTQGYANIAFVESQGVELYGAYQLTGWLGVAGNYAYIDAQDGDGLPRARLPEHSGDITVSLDPTGPVAGTVLVRHNGEEANTDGTTLDGWTRVDVSASYGLGETIDLFGRIENLFDTSYQQVLGYGTPGLSGQVGIRVRY